MVAPPFTENFVGTRFSNSLNANNQTIVGIDDPSLSEWGIGPWVIIFTEDLGFVPELSDLDGATVALLTGTDIEQGLFRAFTNADISYEPVPVVTYREAVIQFLSGAADLLIVPMSSVDQAALESGPDGLRLLPVGFDKTGQLVPFTDSIVIGDGKANELNGTLENDGIRGLAGADEIRANDGDDYVNGGRGADTAFLGNGNDIYIDTGQGGVNGRDTVFGGNGNDTISGGGASDNLNGGDGNDNLNGGDGNDNLNGGDGNDTLNGGAGFDTINGGDGNDIANGGNGNDFINGGAGKDKLSGGFGNDRLNGERGNDTLLGGNGNDTLNGGNQNDVLVGGGGRDVLRGGNGNDTLEGGAGKDILTGGGAGDTFVFKSASDSRTGIQNRDVITDFGANDLIDLSAIDAKTGGGNQAFVFIDDDVFSGTKGELRVKTEAGKTIVQGDRDGDGKADFAIELAGIINLGADDFIF